MTIELSDTDEPMYDGKYISIDNIWGKLIYQVKVEYGNESWYEFCNEILDEKDESWYSFMNTIRQEGRN